MTTKRTRFSIVLAIAYTLFVGGMTIASYFLGVAGYDKWSGVVRIFIMCNVVLACVAVLFLMTRIAFNWVHKDD